MAFNFRPEVIVESMPLLVKGLEMTLLITVGGLALGLFLGVVTGLINTGRNRFPPASRENSIASWRSAYRGAF